MKKNIYMILDKETGHTAKHTIYYRREAAEEAVKMDPVYLRNVVIRKERISEAGIAQMVNDFCYKEVY